MCGERLPGIEAVKRQGHRSRNAGIAHFRPLGFGLAREMVTEAMVSL
jgi:hypothetical protein